MSVLAVPSVGAAFSPKVTVCGIGVYSYRVMSLSALTVAVNVGGRSGGLAGNAAHGWLCTEQLDCEEGP